jgi:alkylhydroperoxidase family enzyme
VPDAVFERARAHFNEQELIALVFTLTTINAWNRLAITMRTEVGNYQPKARPVSQTA